MQQHTHTDTHPQNAPQQAQRYAESRDVVQHEAKNHATAVISLVAERGHTLATAESCTGGLLAAALTDVAGASAAFVGGIVSYANAIKQDILGVDARIVEQLGAVSEACAVAMAQGARRALNTNWSISVTGIAGPSGGSDTKPVGLVWIATCSTTAQLSHQYLFAGTRSEIRQQAVHAALALIWQLIEQEYKADDNRGDKTNE